MSEIKYRKYISRDDLRSEPNNIFVYGDNDQRYGLGGQAKEMRGEPNAIGIRVKKSPSMDNGSFYTDADRDENIKKIAEDLEHLGRVAVPNGLTIVFPLDGIGTGMAMLNRTAPQTFAYLTMALKQMFDITNGNPEQHKKLYSAIDKKPRPGRFTPIDIGRKKKTTKRKLISKPIKKSIKKSSTQCKCKK